MFIRYFDHEIIYGIKLFFVWNIYDFLIMLIF